MKWPGAVTWTFCLPLRCTVVDTRRATLEVIHFEYGLWPRRRVLPFDKVTQVKAVFRRLPQRKGGGPGDQLLLVARLQGGEVVRLGLLRYYSEGVFQKYGEMFRELRQIKGG